MTAQWLTSPTGRAVIEAAGEAPAGPEDVMRLRRRFPDTEPELVGAAIHQAWLRMRELKRRGFNSGFLLTTDGLEQATRPEVADYHARTVTALAGPHARVVDLTCGLGFDAAAMARAGHTVTAIERDPDVAAFARCNLEPLGVHVEVADAVDYPIPADTAVVFVDPARRNPDAPRRVTGESARQLDPTQWSPSWTWVCDLAQRHRVVAKVAPGISDANVSGWDADFVSADGDLVEALLTSGGDGRRRAVLIRDGDVEVIAGGDVTAARDLGGYLIVPDPALVRARALDHLARQVDGGLVHPQISWLTSDDASACVELAKNPMHPASVFAIESAHSFELRVLKNAVRELPHSALTVMARGVQVDVEKVRKQLSTTLDRSAPELIVAIFRGERTSQALLCRRLDAAAQKR